MVAAACGGSSEQAGTGAGTTGATDAPAPSTAPTASPPTTEVGVLKRRDTPPQGVKAQFEFFGEGDGVCFGLDESKPAAVVDFPQLEIAMSFVLCFPGFVAKRPVDAQVRRPDGRVVAVTASDFNSPDGIPYTSWTTLPGDPVGVYSVSATQGSRRGTGTFTVRPASVARMVAAPPPVAPLGTTVRLGLAGFPANRAVELHLYHARSKAAWGYVTTLLPKVDGDGQAIVSIPTAADDPKGPYCVVRRGPKASPDYSCDVMFTLS